jgi:hypothetical protein
VLTERKEIYRNTQIIYSVPKDEAYVGEVNINIGGKHVHTMRLSDGSYATHFLPFKNYDSIGQLAKDVVDKVPYFRESSAK